MLKHTAEPWSLETHQLIEEGFYSGMFPVSDCHELSPEDFQRACECVNALSGIKDVETFVREAKEAQQNIDKLKFAMKRLSQTFLKDLTAKEITDWVRAECNKAIKEMESK